MVKNEKSIETKLLIYWIIAPHARGGKYRGLNCLWLNFKVSQVYANLKDKLGEHSKIFQKSFIIMDKIYEKGGKVFSLPAF